MINNNIAKGIDWGKVKLNAVEEKSIKISSIIDVAGKTHLYVSNPIILGTLSSVERYIPVKNSCSKIAEGFIGSYEGIPIVVLTPEQEEFGLKSKYVGVNFLMDFNDLEF